jgi:hypothetical protein
MPQRSVTTARLATVFKQQASNIKTGTRRSPGFADIEFKTLFAASTVNVLLTPPAKPAPGAMSRECTCARCTTRQTRSPRPDRKSCIKRSTAPYTKRVDTTANI